KRGTVALAVAAVAIGSSVASALLHVSGDVSRKLTRELRALGPNLVLVPARASEPEVAGGLAPAADYLDQRRAEERLRAARLAGAPLLLLVAHVRGQPVQVVGTDLETLRRLHPSWALPPGAHESFMGARLMARLGVREGDSLTLAFAGGDRSAEKRLRAGARLEAGGADDDAWWIPLADAQSLGGLEGRASLFEARLEGSAGAAEAARSEEHTSELQ